MPKQNDRIISWHKARSCWRKKYQGKTFYLATGGVCKGPEDQHGYETALAEWFDTKRVIDSGGLATMSSPAPARESGIRDVFGNQPNLPVKHLQPMASDYSSLPDALPAGNVATMTDAPLDDLTDLHLAEIKQRVEAGERALATYRDAVDKLADFQGYAKKYKRTKISEVDAHFLKCYRTQQFELMNGGGEGSVSAFTIKRRLQHVKRFMEWCYRNEYVSRLPRNLDKTFAQVELPKPKPQPLTKSEVQTIWNYAVKQQAHKGSYRNALFVLLGLNCGYRSGDISTLKHEHIKQRDGRWYIERAREKTGSPQQHILWPITVELLKQVMSNPQHHEYVFIDENGGRLVKESYDKSKSDLVREAFKRIKRKLKFDANHSRLRDTGADWLKQQFPEYPQVVSQHLGHMPHGMHTHYAREHYEKLYECIDAMEKHYGLKL